MRVIARAYGDEPLERNVVGDNSKVVYLVALSPERSTGSDAESGVGFPRASVYAFDAELLNELKRAWENGDHESLARLWGEATPFADPAISTR